MRTFLFLTVSLFSCVTQTSGGEISPKLTPLNSSHDCQNCLFTELGVPFAFKCILANDTNSTDVEFKLGSLISMTGRRESNGVYAYRSYTIKEEDHLLTVRCIASAAKTLPYKTEETNATLYVTKKPNRMTLTTSNVNITCVARGGRPAPTLVMKSEGIVQPVMQSNVRDTLEKQSTYTTNAFVKDLMKLSKGQTISCCTTTSFFTEMCATPQTLDFEPQPEYEEPVETTTSSATTFRTDPATVSIITQTSKVIVPSAAVATDEKRDSIGVTGSASSRGHILTVGWMLLFGVAFGTMLH